jgi:hypothetical protein
MRFSELQRKVKESDDAFKLNTISGTIWNFDTRFPNDVYKPSKGLFRLKKFKESEVAEVADSTTVLPKSPVIPIPAIKEGDFYIPFAEWLKNDIEDVTAAIPLDRNKFKDKWGSQASFCSFCLKTPAQTLMEYDIKAFFQS